MLRKSAAALAVLAVLNTPQVKALGLGEVTVHSALSQPLNAEINLLQVRDLTKTQIIANLADSDDFYLAGVKPTLILSDINFRLEIKDGKGVIHLSTTSPIKEPFLNFLVEVNWPSGRLVREYTLLLDPPVFSAKDLAPRSAPSAPMVAASSPQSMGARSYGASESASKADKSSFSGDTRYKVTANDTLWNIALKTRPDQSISPQKMMLALQRMNPGAFFNNNINRLKSGAVLNIPNKSQILNFGDSESIAEVNRQNAAWKDKAPTSKATAKKRTEQLDARKDSAAQSSAVSNEEQSQLRIVSKAADAKTEEAKAADSAISVDGEAGAITPDVVDELRSKNDELEEQLVVTLEGLDKVERDNDELFQRLDRLADQLESIQRLMMLKDQQVAELQNQLAVAQTVTSAPELAPKKSFMDSPAMLGGMAAGLVALVLGGLLLLKKRKNNDEEAVEEAMVVLDEREGNQVAEEQAPIVKDAKEAFEEIAETPEEPVGVAVDEEDPFNIDSDLGDEFDTLISDDLDEQLGEDLNMDLDIDEPVVQDSELDDFAASLLSDEEYDLAVDDETAKAAAPADDEVDFEISESSMADIYDLESAADKVSDDAIEPDVKASPEAPVDEDDDLGSDLDFILAENAAEASAVDLDTPDEESGVDDVSDDLDALLAERPTLIDESENFDVAPADDLDALLAAGNDEFVKAGSDRTDDFSEQSPEAVDVIDMVAEAAEEDELVVENSALDDLLNAAENADDESLVKAAESVDIEQDLPQSLDVDELDFALDDVETADIEVADLGVESAPESSDDAEMDVDFSALALDEDDADAAEPIESTDALGLGDADALVDGLDLDLDYQDVMAETAAESVAEAVANAADTAVLEADLELTTDEDLEAELSLMLEDEDNQVALDETTALSTEDDLAEDIDYLDGADELGTKLDLARAYIDMGDQEGAKEILQEVLGAGDEKQIAESKRLLDGLS